MHYDIIKEGGGDVHHYLDLVAVTGRLPKLLASSYSIGGEWGQADFLYYNGKGFRISFNDYRIISNTILRARSPQTILELSMSLANPIAGIWDGIQQPTLSRRQFNLRHSPDVKTRAIFEADKIYSTFDIYYEQSYLEEMSKNFPVLAQFLEKVVKNEHASLSPVNYYCNEAMILCTNYIKDNPYSIASQSWIIENKVKEILLAALEIVTSDDPPEKEIKLYSHEEEALIKLHTHIGKLFDFTPSIAELCRYCGMTEFRLIKGFRQLFGFTPHDFHITMRIEEAKRLLLETTELISKISFMVGYSHVQNFCFEFKRTTGMTPSDFRKFGTKRKYF